MGAVVKAGAAVGAGGQAAQPAEARGWRARLDLRFRPSSATSGPRTLLERSHEGPLRVQKALYPEGDEVCHVLVVHPPGGIAGGDQLSISATVEAGAHALVTTPGAGKWYRANGRDAGQHVRLRVAGDLEWLPQEAIVYDAARVRSSLRIDMAPGARCLGWDIVALGRLAAGERFAAGRFGQTIELWRDGRPEWIELTRIDGDDELLRSPLGLGGGHVFGCFWACGEHWSDAALDDLRARLAGRASVDAGGLPALDPTGEGHGAAGIACALTRLAPDLLVGRVTGHRTETVRAQLEALWLAVREPVLGRLPRRPRIWAT
ncbi:urease accessory protein UreD [Derxia gummosa]|uniref:Urease accessory protein UreD n=1 Tax=Derxia gummosa DSM 723 TaxID=1121388 RepID=A0A8B6X8F2_9BURK|nr:urease accessory protein UreD [Derxia gummosa]